MLHSQQSTRLVDDTERRWNSLLSTVQRRQQRWFRNECPAEALRSCESSYEPLSCEACDYASEKLLVHFGCAQLAFTPYIISAFRLHRALRSEILARYRFYWVEPPFAERGYNVPNTEICRPQAARPEMAMLSRRGSQVPARRLDLTRPLDLVGLHSEGSLIAA